MLPSHEGNALDLGPSGLGFALGRNVPTRPQVKSSQKDEGTSAIRALTRSVRRGEPDAFSRFYDLYSFRLYKFLLVLARGDEGQARDVCQAVFIKLVKRFEEFDEEARLWAWLCTVAKNSFIDDCRVRLRGQRFVPLEEQFGQADGESPRELSELLRDALKSLTPEESELLQAAYVDERPLSELADSADQSYKAVQSRLARLRQKLKEQLLKTLRNENRS